MNFILRVVVLAGLVGVVVVRGAPAVTSVHVSFISGNKKTQYSHGSHTRPALVQYRLDAAGTGDDLLHRRQLRSISGHDQQTKKRAGGREVSRLLTATRPARRVGRRPTSFTTSSTTSTASTTLLTTNTRPIHMAAPTTTQMTTRDAKRHRMNHESSKTRTPSSKTKSRIRGSPSPLTFAPVPVTRGGPSALSSTTTTTRSTSPGVGRLGSRVRFVHSSTAKASSGVPSEGKKEKESKAVKRSPYISNFESRGITFPDFDEFGGNEFGALRNLVGSSGGGGGGGSVAAHTHANPESLSPDGVFLPPLPTEASDYAEDNHGGGGHSDPYMADPESAKYAAQHPPFFAAFPHKRSVLDLNERRVEQGLEPNILRSIRPYFAFFEAAK